MASRDGLPGGPKHRNIAVAHTFGIAMTPALITPTELAGRRSDAMLIVQVTSRPVYDAAHLPGAVNVEPAELIAGVPPATGRLPDLERLTRLFRRIGYTHGREVVTLDDEGGGWAGRFAWTLDVIGNKNWRYLDGGLHAWAGAGLPLVRESTAVDPTNVDIVIDRAPIAEAEDIIEALDDPEFLVWDCRSAEEFAGRRAAAARAGHIPGAVNLDWLELMDRRRHMRLVANPAALLAAHGIDARRDIVTHCQTHHRSGLTYMAARLLGFPRIRAYHGSWSEWGNRTDTPIESG